MYACDAAVAGRTVLVVDDVMTTGATLDAIASVMKEKGAGKVWGAVVARTSVHPRLTLTPEDRPQSR